MVEKNGYQLSFVGLLSTLPRCSLWFQGNSESNFKTGKIECSTQGGTACAHFL